MLSTLYDKFRLIYITIDLNILHHGTKVTDPKVRDPRIAKANTCTSHNQLSFSQSNCIFHGINKFNQSS
jgi:hypothetical protein